ncbi:MAG TPA: DUF3037 domain-containing protein [Actinomycetes bacterium]|nr:DUF3037 domain-containing protein [Actinomycetes bacterium]
MSRPSGSSEPRIPFEYAVVRVVPHVERGELVNAGVVVYAQARAYLGCDWHVDEARLRALSPTVDVEGVRAALRAIELVCAGGADAGPAGGGAPGERFRWLVAPRSTVVQPGPVHTGLTTDPAAELAHLMRCLVLVPPPA